MFERFVSTRYLRGLEGKSEGRGFLRFVTVAAICGVAVGVAALLIALAVVRGFSSEIERKIIGFGAHVQLNNFRDEPIDDYLALADSVASIHGVKEIVPVVEEFVLLRKDKTTVDGVALIGTTELPNQLSQSIVQGVADLESRSENLHPLVVGQALAENLEISVGDEVVLFSFRKGGGEIEIFQPRLSRFKISAIYETHLANYDEVFAFTGIDSARELLSYGVGQVSRLDIYVNSESDIQETAVRIDERVGFPIMARSVYEIFRPLFSWVRLQEQIIPVVISVITIVSGFNIIAALLMVVLEKATDIGIMASLGASRKRIKRLFLWIGTSIGVVGIVLGSILALVFASLQARYQIIPLPSESYYMDTAPVAMAATDFLLVGIAVVLMCCLSAYIPARVAANTKPVQVLRLR